jgi:RNA polymerase sigma-70 factor (ECF subfamily)
MNKSAFEHHVRSWRMKAVEVCKSCGADSEEAEDIAQEVMLRLWQMHDVLEKYQSIEAIVTIAARHLLRDHQRLRTTETLNEATLISIGNSPQETLEMIEDEQWLTEKLRQLPTTQRTLLYMRQVERRSHEEIARLLGIEKTSVSTLLARARRTLLEEIKQRNKQ